MRAVRAGGRSDGARWWEGVMMRAGEGWWEGSGVGVGEGGGGWRKGGPDSFDQLW